MPAGGRPSVRAGGWAQSLCAPAGARELSPEKQFAPGNLCGRHSGLLLHFDKPGILHLPGLFPFAVITAGALAAAERALLEGADRGLGRWLNAIQGAFLILGAAVAVVLGYGLWSSRKLPYVPTSVHFSPIATSPVTRFPCLTFSILPTASFAALRLPAALAAAALLLGRRSPGAPPQGA